MIKSQHFTSFITELCHSVCGKRNSQFTWESDEQTKKSPRKYNEKKIHLCLIKTRWGVKFTAGGHSSFFGFVNTFVHIIMYTYYMLAAMGPHMQKYLWWKKYLTVLVRTFYNLYEVVVCKTFFSDVDKNLHYTVKNRYLWFFIRKF